ncbi:hypothetical protein BDR03DRAFT_1055554 [Suillus americanus]|nr:hypothetical protein BDR03DRAFT_1055554 [Suillus americanus]
MPEFSDTIIRLFDGLKKRQATREGGLLTGSDPSAFDVSDPLRLWIIQVVQPRCHYNNGPLQAIQPFNLTDLDWSPQLWVACHNDDEQNACLANHMWEDNGLDVPEDFLDKLLNYLAALQDFYQEKVKILAPKCGEYWLLHLSTWLSHSQKTRLNHFFAFLIKSQFGNLMLGRICHVAHLAQCELYRHAPKSWRDQERLQPRGAEVEEVVVVVGGADTKVEDGKGPENDGQLDSANTGCDSGRRQDGHIIQSNFPVLNGQPKVEILPWEMGQPRWAPM